MQDRLESISNELNELFRKVETVAISLKGVRGRIDALKVKVEERDDLGYLSRSTGTPETGFIGGVE